MTRTRQCLGSVLVLASLSSIAACAAILGFDGLVGPATDGGGLEGGAPLPDAKRPADARDASRGSETSAATDAKHAPDAKRAVEADAAKGPDAPAVLRDAGPPNLLGDSSFTGSACGTAWTVVNSVATVSMVVPDGAPHGLSSCMVCNETDAEPIALAHFEYEPQLPVDASLGYSGTADLLILSDGGVHGPALNVGIGMCSSMDQFRQDAGWVLHRSTTVPCDAGKLTWAVTAMLKPGACFLVYDPTLTASP